MTEANHVYRHPGRRAAILCLYLALAACASTPTPVVDYNGDYDFSTVDTLAMYRDSGAVVGQNPLRLSDMTRDRIDRALLGALEAKGLTAVDDPARADLLLSWHLVTEERSDVRSYQRPTVGVGYAAGFYPYNRYSLYSCWSCRPTETEVTVHDYTLGTFVVDLIDPALEKSVWRSVITSRLKGQPERDQEKYDAAAARILADFPPSRNGAGG